jgi:hypothetical protein
MVVFTGVGAGAVAAAVVVVVVVGLAGSVFGFCCGVGALAGFHILVFKFLSKIWNASSRNDPAEAEQRFLPSRFSWG